MRAIDATFPIDALKGHPGATEKANDLAALGEPLAIPAPALAELMVGAYHAGGWLLRETLALVDPLEVIPVDTVVALSAGRLGAELLRRGKGMSACDLLVAACCAQRGAILVTRDEAFGTVPGLAVERY